MDTSKDAGDQLPSPSSPHSANAALVPALQPHTECLTKTPPTLPSWLDRIVNTTIANNPPSLKGSSHGDPRVQSTYPNEDHVMPQPQIATVFVCSAIPHWLIMSDIDPLSEDFVETPDRKTTGPIGNLPNGWSAIVWPNGEISYLRSTLTLVSEGTDSASVGANCALETQCTDCDPRTGRVGQHPKVWPEHKDMHSSIYRRIHFNGSYPCHDPVPPPRADQPGDVVHPETPDQAMSQPEANAASEILKQPLVAMTSHNLDLDSEFRDQSSVAMEKPLRGPPPPPPPADVNAASDVSSEPLELVTVAEPESESHSNKVNDNQSPTVAEGSIATLSEGLREVDITQQSTSNVETTETTFPSAAADSVAAAPAGDESRSRSPAERATEPEVAQSSNGASQPRHRPPWAFTEAIDIYCTKYFQWARCCTRCMVIFSAKTRICEFCRCLNIPMGPDLHYYFRAFMSQEMIDIRLAQEGAPRLTPSWEELRALPHIVDWAEDVDE